MHHVAEFAAVLKQADELLLDLQLHFFKWPDRSNPNLQNSTIRAISEFTDNINNGNYQFLSNISLPENELCCNGKGEALNSMYGAGTTGRGNNYFLINGGWNPEVWCAAGGFQTVTDAGPCCGVHSCIMGRRYADCCKVEIIAPHKISCMFLLHSWLLVAVCVSALVCLPACVPGLCTDIPAP